MKACAQIGWIRQQITGSPAAAALLCVALAQGMVASSLLVECIPADGSTLVELLGQDPCHQLFAAIELHWGDHHPATPQMEYDSTDPCVDLSLESLAISAGVIRNQPPAISAADQLARGSLLTGMVWFAPPAETLFKQARAPGRPADAAPQRLFSLRI